MAAFTSQKRRDYCMQTNLLKHSGSFDWKINCSNFRSGMLRSDVFSPDEACRTKWKMTMYFPDTKSNVMHVRIRRADADGDGLPVNICLKMRNREGSEFLTESVDFRSCESGSDWGLNFKRPSRQNVLVIPTSSGQAHLIHPMDEDEFFVKAWVEVNDCCPFTQIFPVMDVERPTNPTGPPFGDNCSILPKNEHGFDIRNNYSYEHACQIDWNLKNFPRYRGKMWSPIFAPVVDCKTRWRIGMTLQNGDIQQMRIKIRRVDNERIKVLQHFCLIVKNTKGDLYYQERAEAWGTKEWTIVSCRPSYKQVLLKPGSDSEIFRLERDDTLIVKIIISLERCCSLLENASKN